MKILILTQGVKQQAILLMGLSMAKEYAKTIGLDFEYTFKETTKKFNSFTFESDVVGHAVGVRGEEIIDEYTGYKVVCLIFDADKIYPRPTNPMQQPLTIHGATPIQIPEFWYNVYPEVLCDYFLHEICHAGYWFGNNTQGDLTHKQQTFPQWQNKQPHEYYLWLLQGLKQYLEQEKPMEPILRLKSTNKEAVKRLQTLLNTKGYGLIVDGDFGMKTLSAVKDFQKAVVLTVDGVVGQKTWAELKKKPK